MNYYLHSRVIAGICCCGVLICCGEKPAQPENADKADAGKSTEQTTPTTLIQHTHDGTKDKSGKELAFKITAEIYDAPALPLGEIYTTREQLTGTSTKMAELVNLVNSGEPAKLEEKDCTFSTDAIMGENGEIIDITTELKLYDLEMKFSTTFKFNYPVFYEMSMAGKPDRMYVIVINTEKLPQEK